MVRTGATIDDLETFLSEQWREYCAVAPTRRTPYKIRMPFQDWEARFFMRGLELGLFKVSIEQTAKGCNSQLHYQPLAGDQHYKTGFFKGGPNGGPDYCREVVTQFAALAELIDYYGWPVENILAEPRERGKGIYPVDGLVFDKPWLEGRQTGQWPSVRIALEAKIQRSDVDQLMRQITECAKLGRHDKRDCPGNKTDHAKYQVIVEWWRPAYFLVVTPEERGIYSVRWDNETSFSLVAVSNIPRWQSIPN